MRHRKAGYHLNRTTAHRTAMLRNLAAGLFEHGQITTTVPKAKALQPFVEKIVTTARHDTLPNRRRVISKLGGDRWGFDWLYLDKHGSDDDRQRVDRQREHAEQFFKLPESEQVERNRYGELRKAPKLVRHIFENVAPRFKDRPGGYTRIVRLGQHRVGDGTELCVIQFVGAEEGPEVGGRPSRRRRVADKRTAFAAALRKAPKAAAAAAEAPEAAAEGPAAS